MSDQKPAAGGQLKETERVVAGPGPGRGPMGGGMVGQTSGITDASAMATTNQRVCHHCVSAVLRSPIPAL